MGVFVEILQGAYAYLLIFQIVIVTLLFLMLLWLVIKRTHAAAVTVGAQSLEVASVARVLAVTEGPNPEIESLKTQIEALKVENEKTHKYEENNYALQDKLKYLESKLLEYEILQEEIGALSSLKLENEKLKQRLVFLESQPGGDKGPMPEPKMEPTLFESGPIGGTSPTATHEDTPKPEVDMTVLAERAIFFDPGGSVRTVTSRGAEPATEGSAPNAASSSPDSANLDKLLTEIDGLTKRTDNPK